ncbi:MAG: hypothetical protein EWM48_00110 [Sphaerochaeta sp.]|nr:MAG: hypothetical protein EWM48_00110 [Sphaerochaeta sp.]
MKIRKTSQNSVEILNPLHIVTITYTLTYEDKRQHPIALEIEDDMVFVSFEGIGTIEDRLAPGRKGVTVDRTWILVKEGSYRLQAGFFTTDEGVPNDLFIPAVWYRDNTKGSGLFPSIDHSTIWSFLETRMSIPCCLQLSGGKRHFLCATEAAAEERFVASVTNDPHGAIISIPGWEGPYSYQGKKALIDTTSMPRPALMVPSGGLIYRRTFHLATYRGMRGMEAYVAFVASLPKAKPTDLPHPLSWNHWMELKLTRLINLVRRSENNLAYIIMGEGNGEVQDVYEFTGASFLVKSIQGACELARFTEHEPTLDCLQAARQSLAKRFSLVDDSRLLATVAKKIGDFFLKAERREGVFQDNHDLRTGQWGGYLGIGEFPEFAEMVNSRCNGEAMKHYLRLAKELRQLGYDVSPYIDLARRVSLFYSDIQLSSGSFGRWWTPEGKPKDIQGTNGAYIGSFLCALIPMLEESDPLKKVLIDAVHKAYMFYARLADEGAFYGDTLDADSCDKEAGVALLSFFMDLYHLEGDKRHLKSAHLAAEFIIQWIWQQSSYLPGESPLGRKGFSTLGMTSVSVAHHHLDCYGMAIAYEFLRFATAANLPFYAKQASLMIAACKQLVHGKENNLGRDESFFGWQPEQINHTNWEYFNRPELMNGHYEIDIAWVTILTLSFFDRIRGEFPEALQE